MRYFFGHGPNPNTANPFQPCEPTEHTASVAGSEDIISTGYAVDCRWILGRHSDGQENNQTSLSRDTGHFAPGLLFEVNPKPSYPWACQQHEVDVLTPDGQMVTASTLLLDHTLVPTSTDHPHDTGIPIPYVFVYGTLMRGECNHHWFAEDKILSCVPASTQGGILYDTGFDYPVLQLTGNDSDETIVHGELVHVQHIHSVLLKLDELEEFQSFKANSNLYERRIKKINVNGKIHLAWIYVLGQNRCTTGHSIIPSGNWRDRARPSRWGFSV